MPLTPDLAKIVKEPKKLAPEDVFAVISKVNGHATDLIENMREIIWAMNSSYDNLPLMIAYIRNYVVEFLDEKEIECEAKPPTAVPDILISGEKRRNIFLCVKEAAHNIVKHAKASKVHFSIQIINETLEIKIKDNGRGFDLNHRNKFGAGLRSMQKRMKDINASFDIKTDTGTQIELKIPLKTDKR